MIIIRTLRELIKNEMCIRKITKDSNNFEHLFENLYAIHKSNQTAITLIDEKNKMMTTLKKRDENIYECCMNVDPIYLKCDGRLVIDFIKQIYKIIDKKVLYFPLVYENSLTFQFLKDNYNIIKYKRLYTSIVDLSKYSNVFAEIEGNAYFSQRNKNKFEKIGIIKNIKGKDATEIISSVEKQSWKSKVGQDMVTQKEKLIYYNELIKNGTAEITVAFDKEKNNPIAYRIDSFIGNRAIQLKTSFDERYKKYSPGTYLTLYDTIKYYKEKEFDSIDLFGGPNVIKDTIETERIERYDMCYGDKNTILELKEKRMNWDYKNYKNFKEKNAIRKIYKIFNEGDVKMFNPKIMFIRVSTRCNSGCFMCRYANKHESYNITDEQFEDIIKKMKEEGTYEMMRFTGGEPLLHPHLPYFIKRCSEEGFKTSIITNGYLMPRKYKELIEAGLNQVIFSLDGSSSEIHDELRNLKGCFNNIVEGIRLLKENAPNILIRVNTVASKYNIKDLNNILKLLQEYNVDFWSIIPLRSSKVLWNDGNVEDYIEIYKEFNKKVQNIEKPRLLGYSKQWGGRNEEEIHRMFYENKLYSPVKQCHLVDRVRFYIPDMNEIVPCNCASHRTNQIKVDLDTDLSIEENTEIMRNWLAQNGPSVCTGCEPLNVYLAEHPESIDEDLFSF